jgi:hypothetical protein
VKLVRLLAVEQEKTCPSQFAKRQEKMNTSREMDSLVARHIAPMFESNIFGNHSRTSAVLVVGDSYFEEGETFHKMRNVRKNKSDDPR